MFPQKFQGLIDQAAFAVELTRSADDFNERLGGVLNMLGSLHPHVSRSVSLSIVNFPNLKRIFLFQVTLADCVDNSREAVRVPEVFPPFFSPSLRGQGCCTRFWPRLACLNT